MSVVCGARVRHRDRTDGRNATGSHGLGRRRAVGERFGAGCVVEMLVRRIILVKILKRSYDTTYISVQMIVHGSSGRALNRKKRDTNFPLLDLSLVVLFHVLPLETRA